MGNDRDGVEMHKMKEVKTREGEDRRTKEADQRRERPPPQQQREPGKRKWVACQQLQTVSSLQRETAIEQPMQRMRHARLPLCVQIETAVEIGAPPRAITCSQATRVEGAKGEVLPA